MGKQEKESEGESDGELQVSLSFPFAFPFLLLLPSRFFIDEQRDLEQVHASSTSYLGKLEVFQKN